MILIFFKRLFQNLCTGVSEVFSLSKLQKKYPNCAFYPGAKIYNSVFGNYNIVFNDVLMAECAIGDHTYIQKRATLFNADIGKFCSIASGVSIGPGMHKTDRVSTHPAFYLKDTPLLKKFSDKDLFISYKRTSIGHDVWIGEKAIVLDGITIGHGAIIAASSVVTKDVAPYSIVGGIPAKHIRSRFDETKIEGLLKLEWWNYPEDWLAKHYIDFGEISNFLLKAKQE